MRIYIPSQLQSYTKGKNEVELSGETVGEVLNNLDKLYPGARFRIVSEQDTLREHVRIFINQEIARGLSSRLEPGDELHIVCALSGG